MQVYERERGDLGDRCARFIKKFVLVQEVSNWFAPYISLGKVIKGSNLFYNLLNASKF